MQEKQVKNLIKTWYEKARFETNSFSKFTFLWICFNAWIDYRSDKSTDTLMFKDLSIKSSNMNDIILAYDSAMQSDTGTFKNNIKSLLLMSPVKDARGLKPPVSIADENDFKNIVWAIYRIRCNLFHGGKEVNDTRDKKLVVVAQRILEKWVGNLKAQWQTA